MYPDINININLPGGIAGAAQVAEDVSVVGPPPDEGEAESGFTEAAPPPDQAGGAEMSAGTAAGMPPGPEETAMGGDGDATLLTAPGPDEFFHEGLPGRSSGGMSGEPPGPEAADAPPMSDAEDKAASKKPRAKGDKGEK